MLHQLPFWMREDEAPATVAVGRPAAWLQALPEPAARTQARPEPVAVTRAPAGTVMLQQLPFWMREDSAAAQHEPPAAPAAAAATFCRAWTQPRPEPAAVIPAGPERAPIPPPPGLLPAVRVPLGARNGLPAYRPPAIAAPQPAPAPSSAAEQAFMAEVRLLAARLHSDTPNLKTKTASRAATSRGEVILKAMILENDKIRAACKLLSVIPAFALESCLGDRLSVHSPAEAVDAVRHRVVRDGGHKALAEAVTDYSSLLDHMRSLGGAAAERAAKDRVTVGDVNRYLTFRQDRAVTLHAHEVDDFPAPAALPCEGIPTKRKKDGASSAPSVKKKLKLLADSWAFCIPGDKRVGIPAPVIHGPARQKSSAPVPPVRMIRDLQKLASDPTVSAAARQVARACLVMTFAILRGEQIDTFGIVAVSTTDGRRTLYAKTRKKQAGSPIEYIILPLSGIIEGDDSGAWFEVGGEALDDLNGQGDFLARAFTGPRGPDSDNPFYALSLENAPMSQAQMDSAIAHVLVHLGYPPEVARMYTRHSFKHFLPTTIANGPNGAQEEAGQIANEVGRWAGSLLSRRPELIGSADQARSRHIQKLSAMPQNYSEPSQVKQLREHAQYQIDRVRRAVTRAGDNLEMHGGFQWLEP
jgi:hypothetical protein